MRPLEAIRKVERQLNREVLPHAWKIFQQADKLLKSFGTPFNETDWEKLSSQQKVAAGLLGKWVCDRCLRVFREAIGQPPAPTEATLMSLLDSSGLGVGKEKIAAIETVDKSVGSPEPTETGWECDYKLAYTVAHGVRSVVMETLTALDITSRKWPN